MPCISPEIALRPLGFLNLMINRLVLRNNLYVKMRFHGDYTCLYYVDKEFDGEYSCYYRDAVLVTFKMPEKKQRKERRVDLGSQFEAAVHQDGESRPQDCKAVGDMAFIGRWHREMNAGAQLAIFF